MSLDFWQKRIIVAVVFNIEDCGICLARVDELIAFLDSVTKNIEAELVAIAISQSYKKLLHYLSIAPKPCPVLIDTSSIASCWFHKVTPQIIIIDRRRFVRVTTGLISAAPLRKRFRDKIRIAIMNG